MIIKGTDLMVFVDDEAIAQSTRHTLEVSSDTIDISTKDTQANWGAVLGGTKSWKATADTLYTEGAGENGHTMSQLFEIMEAGTAVTLKMGIGSANPPHTLTSGQGYVEGQAYIASIKVDAQVSGVATLSVEFQGTGELAANSYTRQS